jgi:pentatricopeptide repeat protein
MRQMTRFLRKANDLKFNNKNLKSKIKEGKTKEALKFYADMPERDISTYTMTFVWCIKNRFNKEAEGVLFDMQKSNVAYDPLFYNFLIEFYSRTNPLKMIRAFEDLKAIHGLGNVLPITYGLIIMSIFYHDPNVGMNWLQDNLEYIAIDAYVLSIVCRVFAKNVTLPIELCMKVLIKAQIDYTEYIFNPLIEAFLKRKEETAALAVLQRINGPTHVTFNLFIKWYCAEGEVEKVEQLMNMMKEKGIPLDDFSFDPILRLYAKVDDQEKFFKILSMVKFKKETLSGVVVSTLNGLAHFNLWTEFMDWLLQFVQIGILRDIPTHQMIFVSIAAAIVKMNLEESLPTWQKLKTLDPVLTNLIWQKAIPQSHAKKIYDFFTKVEFEANAKTFQIFITEFYKERKYRQAINLFNTIPEYLTPTRETIDVIVDSYKRSGQYDKSLEFQKKYASIKIQ